MDVNFLKNPKRFYKQIPIQIRENLVKIMVLFDCKWQS